MPPSHALEYAKLHRPRFIAELKEFVRFPTISAQPRYSKAIRDCAAWLADQLRRAGMKGIRILSTGGQPVVYGAWERAPGRPTVLIYGHYDVQPVDPLKEWRFPPFEPTIVGENLYGRGACDDKGQLFTHVKALECYLQTARALPVNVKCLFEGEEEAGSIHLLPFVARHKRALKADVAVMSDTRILAPNRPALNYAERGTLALELEVRGPQRDLHSGNFGGAVHNPVQALCEMIAKLHDAEGRIAIPGLYDSVRDWPARERLYMKRTGPSDGQILREARVKSGWGERGCTLYERTTLRPALTVNGISGGYQGPGSKGVIPARAAAKLTFRLVPDQDPDEIDSLFREHVVRLTPPDVRATVRTLSAAKPALVNPHHPAMSRAAFAYRKGFGSSPVFLRSGGTIPVVNTFQEVLGVPTVLMGFALPDDSIHAPNEKFHLPNFSKGIATCIWFLWAMASVQRSHKRGVPELIGVGAPSDH
jgi:acetylornithine deacetylase/succinyl-diaminopimelate desuccinylase-like protein